jgi:hypothetical protein
VRSSPCSRPSKGGRLQARATGGGSFVPEAGERWIAISLSQQRITAYEGAAPVFTDLVSTGAAAKGLTPAGAIFDAGVAYGRAGAPAWIRAQQATVELY